MKTKTTIKKNKSKFNNKINNPNDCNNNSYINSINEYEYECLICLEIKNNNNEKSIKLNDLEICEKQCECNGWFHKSCLDSWFVIKFSCPICRNSINSFTPYQINHTQTHVQIIETRVSRNDFVIIIFSIMFVYWFYF